MPINTPPSAPNRNNPSTFSSDMDSFLAWLVIAVPQFNAISGMTTSGSFNSGSAAAPSFNFLGDTNTGIFSPGADIMGFVTAGSEVFRINAANQLILGGSASTLVTGTGATRIVSQATAANGAAATFALANTVAANAPGIQLAKSKGTTLDDYTLVGATDWLGYIRFFGADGSAMVKAAEIIGQVMNTPAANDVRGQIIFRTGSGVGGAVTSRLTIDDTAIQAQLPYGYMAAVAMGGAVTQLTSRATAVTLNKICGEITLFNTAGSPTPASFTVNNSMVAATDNVLVSVKSGTNTYQAWCSAKTAGTFTVTFYAAVGTAADAPVFHYDIIKSANN